MSVAPKICTHSSMFKKNGRCYRCEPLSEAEKPRTSNKKGTAEKFIKRAKEVHGDTYDYSKVEYIGTHTKVIIICKEHGEFLQSPNSHTSGGHGCNICRAEKRRLTIGQFIEKAKEVHGDTYDYSKVEYIGNKDKVIIICKEHGEFSQIPSSHFAGKGCKACGYVSSRDTQQTTNTKFLTKAKRVHGDTYDYSKVAYINAKTPIVIICREHGEFEQTPDSHINKGSGCNECGNMRIRAIHADTAEKFIEKAKKMHGDTYDYSKVVYINNSTNVTIICKEHGEFSQMPLNHLKGKGCHHCGVISRADTQRHTVEYFIKKAKEVHGDLYDYSKANYINYNTPLTVICKIHGDFTPTPYNHINNGSGCPICGEIIMRKAYLDRPTILYYVKVEHKGLVGYKIGITTRDTLTRYAEDIRHGTHITILDEVMYETGKPAFEREQSIIKQYKQFIHPQGESMLFKGASELFDRDILNKEVV